MVSSIESRSAIISWTVPYSGNSLILSYQIEYKPSHRDWNSKEKSVETVTGSVNTITLRNLHPLTSYQLKMRCQNAIGYSDYSDIVQFTTDEEGEKAE